MPDPPDVSYLVPEFEITIGGKKLKPEELKIITSVSVDKGIGMGDTFSFDVQDEMENGKFKWLGNDLFKFGKDVTIKLGYVGKLAHTINATIESITTSFSAGLTPTFTVGGSHKGFAKLTVQNELKDYSKKKDSDIVKEIAGAVGLTPEVDATEEAEADPKKYKKVGDSYWNYLKHLANRNKEFEFFIDDGKLIFRKAKTSTSPVFTFTWGKNLLSFNSTLDVSKLVSEVVVQGTKNNKAIEGKAASGKEGITSLGSKTGSKIAKEVFGDRKKYISGKKVDDKADSDNVAQAALEATSNKLVTCNVKTPGMPEIKPGICIEFKGLGDWFNGKYYVSKTTHTISSSGYDTSFSVWRNAL
jgi:phage protein D